MCGICEDNYELYEKEISCCRKVTKLPDKYLYVRDLTCYGTDITEIPKTYIHLHTLNCAMSKIQSIPETLTELIFIDCTMTKVRFLSNNFTQLLILWCNRSDLIYIPDTFTELVRLFCNSKYILISPKIFKRKSNNKRYKIFTNCQKNIKRKYQQKEKLKYLITAYNPIYLIGYNTKQQLKRKFVY